MTTLAVVNIGELVTLRGAARPRAGTEMRELGMVRDGVLLVEGGRIVAAGSRSDLQVRIPADAQIIDACGGVVTPGWVDAHTHLIFAGNRAAEFEQRIDGASYQQIAAAGGGIQSTVQKTREASDAELLSEARTHLRWMMQSGTTTVEAKSGYGLDLEHELRMLRLLKQLGNEGPARIIATLLAAHTVPRAYQTRRGEYLRLIVDEILPQVAQEDLAEYCDVFCDDHAFTVDEARLILTAAQQLGMKLRVHAEQFRAATGARLAAELGAATADHLEAIEAETIGVLKGAGVQPVLLPGSVFALGRGEYPPARRMIEAGLGVVLATDFNPGSSPIASMAMTMSLACVAMKMTPAEALTAASINAAYSVNRGAMVGSLEAGKQADFLIHEFRDYREIAYYIASPARPRVFVAGSEVRA